MKGAMVMPDWYVNGGIFTKPSVIDKGDIKETLLPLKDAQLLSEIGNKIKDTLPKRG